MKLGTKIVLYNLILGILGTAVLYVLVLMVWMKSFEQLEAEGKARFAVQEAG